MGWGPPATTQPRGVSLRRLESEVSYPVMRLWEVRCGAVTYALLLCDAMLCAL